MRIIIIVIILLSSIGSVQASLKMNVDTNNYDVRGYNIKQLRDYMKNNAREYTQTFTWSSTTYELDWNYTHLDRNEGCFISQVNVDMKVIQVIPELHNEVTLSTEDYKLWRSFVKGSDYYQDRHQNIIFRHAKILGNKIKTIGSRSNCSLLEYEANNVAKHVLKELKEERQKFDIETDYGAKVGAHIELDSDFN
jgi:predicted secreted Zn-dependent protease